MNSFPAPGELGSFAGRSQRGHIGIVEDAQATAERMCALMQAIHLAVHDAGDMLGVASDASGMSMQAKCDGAGVVGPAFATELEWCEAG